MEVFTREPRVAFAIHPEFVGRKFEVVLGKKSGRQSIKVKLAEMGIEASDEIVGKILEEVKRLGIQKKSILSDQEFKEIVKNFCHR
jgi:methanogen homocitrate synthase